MNKELIFIANWKMYLTHHQTLHWFIKQKEELERLNKTIIFCPIITAIPLLTERITVSTIRWGAQQCSAHDLGAYTGQISAQSLKEIGCSYGLVGHQEQRSYFQETNQIIARKVHELAKQAIIPIVCIGETKREESQPFVILTEQLEDVASLPWQSLPCQELIIAYEPKSAIGSGSIPSLDHLRDIIRWIKVHSASFLPFCSVKIVYGGSVSPETIDNLKKIEELDGFLIGKASLDFQALKKIVL